jgi:hypothetical protein
MKPEPPPEWVPLDTLVDTVRRCLEYAFDCPNETPQEWDTHLDESSRELTVYLSFPERTLALLLTDTPDITHAQAQQAAAYLFGLATSVCLEHTTRVVARVH